MWQTETSWLLFTLEWHTGRHCLRLQASMSMVMAVPLKWRVGHGYLQEPDQVPKHLIRSPCCFECGPPK